jgi:co-chaperonin GroES (HSP10)
MAIKTSVAKGKVRALRNRVLVSEMHFGEQKTASGIIIKNDDGTTRGIYPRWAKVHNKGPENKDDYEIGDWILIEHGRWTRSFTVDEGSGEVELRMVDPDCILMYSHEKPDGVQIGNEYSDTQGADIRPEDFMR